MCSHPTRRHNSSATADFWPQVQPWPWQFLQTSCISVSTLVAGQILAISKVQPAAVRLTAAVSAGLWRMQLLWLELQALEPPWCSYTYMSSPSRGSCSFSTARALQGPSFSWPHRCARAAESSTGWSEETHVRTAHGMSLGGTAIPSGVQPALRLQALICVHLRSLSQSLSMWPAILGLFGLWARCLRL